MVVTAAVLSGWIYVLYDPRNGNVRYVGQTQCAEGVQGRLSQHVRSANSVVRRTRLSKWLFSLASENTSPKALQIAELPHEQLNAAEIEWITHFRSLGCDLVNGTPGGTGGPIRLGMKNSDQHKQRAGAKHRGRKLPESQIAKMRSSKRANTAECARLASLANIGGQAAAARNSVPRSCVLCRTEFASRKTWRNHYINDHTDIVLQRRRAACDVAREARWSR